ncbi:MAG: right-handed parallel beta-helix repeat-containing protein, partial [Thermoplasmata archaeon]|nr:right-handed parallel beta-helix repeat-containing protein [Thermoplasmata archaeon]
MDRSIPCFVLVAVLLLSAGSLGHPTSAPARPGVVPSSILGVGHLPGRSAPRDPMALLPGSPVAEALHHPGIVRPAISPALTIIYPNGTVSNVSAPITVSGNNYTVTSSFVGGLEIERNQTFLHGGGFVITTDLSLTVGVTVWNATGVTIHGLGVHGGTEGFLVANSQSVHLLAVTPNASTSWTIDIEASSNVTVSASTVIGGSGILAVHVLGLNVSGDHFTNASFFAVYANYASNVEISGDHAEGPFGNVLLEYDEAATISRNVFGGGEYGIYAYSVDALVLRGNAINGSLLGLYFDGTDGVSASGDRVTNASESLTVNSVVNATFDNELLAHAAAQAIGIQSASQVTVENSNATKAAFRGAWIDSSSNVTLDAVNVAGFGAFGVQANDSNGVIVKGVNASGSNQSSSYSVYLNSDLVTQVLNTTGNGTGYGFFATGANGL